MLAALATTERERILVLDGAMGTQIQGLRFDEEHFRREAFAGCACHAQSSTSNAGLGLFSTMCR
ncbi:hypothetical protein BAE40_13375 [Mesorhizobium loti]|nr:MULTISPECIES: hypothetical protein [Mesorhizobium]OBP89899.1 hypothetical protein BAE40_13375 [Mesorhizobium loti]